MIDAAKKTLESRAPQAPKAPTAYTPPSVTPLGGLEQVQAGGGNHYWDSSSIYTRS